MKRILAILLAVVLGVGMLGMGASSISSTNSSFPLMLESANGADIDIDQLFDLLWDTPTDRYNPRIARFSARLSYMQNNNSANLRNFLEDIGFTVTQYTPSYWHANAVEYTIAHFPSRFWPNSSTPLHACIIIVRGTPFNAQWLGNLNVSFGGTYHSGFYLARDFVWNDLPWHGSYNPLFPPWVFEFQSFPLLITGHSRGGAVANLLSQTVFYPFGTSNPFQNRSHTYTFAAPNVFATGDLSWREGSTFNIINRNDIVPLLPNNLLSFGSRVWGRHGINLYATMTSRWLHATNFLHHHEMSMYYRWMQENADSFIGSIIDGHPTLVTINSPVDVRVYNSQGQLAGEIVNNIPSDADHSQVFAWLGENGEKQFFLPYGETFTVRITATDSGTMSYILETLDENAEEALVRAVFENVALEEGRLFTSEIVNNEDVRLYLVLNEQETVEILPCGQVRPCDECQAHPCTCDNTPPPPAPWWANLPAFVQFLLRWVFFGWAWM